MTFNEFKSSLSAEAPSPALHLALRALWWDGKGNWAAAHECAQQDEGDLFCDWVHAYLHRKEGDLPNARYWYRQAGKPAPSTELVDEWQAITKAILSA